MVDRDTTHAPFLHINIAGSVEIGHKNTLAFEWKSFMNGGYIIRAVISDPYLNILKALVTQEYLSKMRNIPTEVIFQIGWQGSNGKKSNHFKAFLVDVRATGTANYGRIEFIAIDPPSWYLNAGTGDGRIYKGKISSVIQQVVNDFGEGQITAEVSDTQDSDNGRWAMMRMDPKTFIKSMLDWSCKLCKKQTTWITASDGDTDNNDKPKIIIKEQAELPTDDLGIIHCTAGNNSQADLIGFDFASDAIISEYQTRLVTQGISSVSGKYIDKSSDEKDAVVNDEKTSQKYNARVGPDRGFKKPSGEKGTAIMAVPELNGRELGMKYADYIDGRARARFMNMLPFVMRLKASIRGNPALTQSTKLGVSTVNLQWAGSFDPGGFFMGGNWMYYGFHHKLKPGSWITDLYLYRFDSDAAATPLP